MRRRTHQRAGASVPRGLRNNNPGNLKKTALKWKGKVAGADPVFETFCDLPHGIRALARTLITYREKHGLETPGAIISRWAPIDDDNHTDAYAAFVADRTGCAVDGVIPAERFEDLVAAICFFENGQEVDRAVIREGVQLL